MAGIIREPEQISFEQMRGREKLAYLKSVEGENTFASTRKTNTMDAISSLSFDGQSPITSVEMHTTGEPARIIIKGYPTLTGTLLEQRSEARAKHDHIRRRLMLEPAGHLDMYGAILRKDTELTESGTAHIGVLFIHSEGYSTMCGHATIALARLLIDTHDPEVFPRRHEIQVDPVAKTAQLNLHAPCGLVKVTVPVTADGTRSDPSRPVSFVNVPSFSTGADISIDIPPQYRWPELGDRDKLEVSFCFGGAFTCLVSTEQLGFGQSGLQQPVDHAGLNNATKNLKAAVNTNPIYRKYMQHPQFKELDSLYTLIVVDKSVGEIAPRTKGAETGLCFFADQQVDRSPTGSAVAARVAHAYATGRLDKGESWTYHSLLSNAFQGRGGFIGTVLEETQDFPKTEIMLANPIRVKVEGQAYYLGSYTFVAENEDPLREQGFLFNKLDSKKISR